MIALRWNLWSQAPWHLGTLALWDFGTCRWGRCPGLGLGHVDDALFFSCHPLFAALSATVVVVNKWACWMIDGPDSDSTEGHSGTASCWHTSESPECTCPLSPAYLEWWCCGWGWGWGVAHLHLIACLVRRINAPTASKPPKSKPKNAHGMRSTKVPSSAISLDFNSERKILGN